MTPQEAAEWMLAQYRRERFLYQEAAASYLLHLHDQALAYHDQNGNACVGKLVLKAFNALTPDVVYERGEKLWRDRLDSDQLGRQQ